MAKLTDPVSILKGVGPTKAKQFAALNIFTLGDLICHFPRAYEDRTRLVTIDKLEVDKPACFKAMVMNTPRTSHIRKGLDLTKVQVADHTARLNLTFFNRKFTTDQLQYGKEYIFYGAVSGDFIGYSMNSPTFESLDSEPVVTRRILPIYPLTAGLSNASILKAVRQALAICNVPEEIIPEKIRMEYGILPAERAYYAIHEPSSMEEAELAKRRLIFEEFFIFSAGLSLMRAARAGKRTEAYQNCDLTPFYKALPFSLTGAQRRAIGEITADMQRGAPMNRLIQGDVGSGKTAVAAALCYNVIQNGLQAALMAPTEILATQHYESLSALLAPCGIHVALITGSTRAKAKREILEGLLNGEIQLIVGTHALISEGVEFKHLALVITDEQHRFGVGQRTALAKKGNFPHTLVMSATPIPRTLALMIYGDLDVSVLDELPPGRQPIETFLIDPAKRRRAFGYIQKHIDEGRQAYIVCPLIEENNSDMASVKAYAEIVRGYFGDMPMGILHGRMKPKEKDAVMADFSAGDTKLLLSTTVVEVGVDVPNAVIMMIENAERYGLSQLHQLRGRVGRGKHRSTCILVTEAQNEEAIQRLRMFCRTTDGFKVADEDLRLRGPGDFFGERQHGLPKLKIADMMNDMQVLSEAQTCARSILERDPQLADPALRGLKAEMRRLFSAGGGTVTL